MKIVLFINDICGYKKLYPFIQRSKLCWFFKNEFIKFLKAYFILFAGFFKKKILKTFGLEIEKL